MKKGKKILKYLGLALLTLTMGVSTSSCGFLTSEDEEVTTGIASMIVTQNEDGTQTLTITYLDEDREDDVFTLPAGGDTGFDGVSIVGMTIEQISPYENLVTIYLANAETPYVTFIIPSGASITNIEVIKDDPNSTTGWVIVTLSDGSTRQIEVYYTSRGDEGKGIIGMSYTTDSEGRINGIIFVYTDGTSISMQFDYIQGETGYSITLIQTYIDLENGQYHIVIYYDGYDDDWKPSESTDDDDSSGESEESEQTETHPPLDISFDIPSDPYTWYNGEGAPDEDLGVVGDHYMDIKNLIIYEKKDSGWELILNLSSYAFNSDKVNITFKLNDTTYEPAAMPSIYNNFYSNGDYVISVPTNTYFTQTMAIPIPTRSGYSSTAVAYSYDFMGWCTSSTGSPVAGYLTDLTALNYDMTFYALWE